MNRDDRQLREKICNEDIMMPEKMSDNIDSVLDSFKGRATGESQIFPIVIRAVAVLLIVLFIILPNVSSEVAYAMSQIPVIGSLVKVITIAEYSGDDEYHSEHVRIPEIEMDSENQTDIDYLNADIKELTDMAIEEFRETCADLPDAHLGLFIDYETVTNTENWFALKLIIANVSANNSVNVKYYNINKERGRVLALSELFVDEFDYISVLSANLCEQMQAQNDEFGEKVYWVYSYEETDLAFDKIKADQNYYFNEAGDLVIVFDKYQVAPGYVGCPEFTIPKEVYVGYLMN